MQLRQNEAFPTFGVLENTFSHSSRAPVEISPCLRRYYPFVQPAVSRCPVSEIIIIIITIKTPTSRGDDPSLRDAAGSVIFSGRVEKSVQTSFL